MIGVL